MCVCVVNILRFKDDKLRNCFSKLFYISLVFMPFRQVYCCNKSTPANNFGRNVCQPVSVFRFGKKLRNPQNVKPASGDSNNFFFWSNLFYATTVCSKGKWFLFPSRLGFLHSGDGEAIFLGDVVVVIGVVNHVVNNNENIDFVK